MTGRRFFTVVAMLAVAIVTLAPIINYPIFLGWFSQRHLSP
jgi:hypothetical protein